MKLIAKLTPAQRATLTSIHDEIISLWRKRLELARDLSSKMTRYAELIGRIPELEAAADGGSIEASRELLAIKDQIERLVVAIERHENGIVSEFLQEVNSASAQTLATIKEITRPLVKEHLEQLTNLLSPYCEFRHHAKGIAEQTHSYNSAAFFVGPIKITHPFEDEAAAFAQLDVWRIAVDELLASGKAWEYKGGDTKPDGEVGQSEEVIIDAMNKAHESSRAPEPAGV